jgi:cytochrome c oxidase subunit II
MLPIAKRTLPAFGAWSISGCAGPQSALRPAGRDAETVAELFWWMAGGAAVIWAITIGIAIYSITKARPFTRERGQRFILAGGAAFPVVVLATLLIFGLRLMPELLAHGAADGPQIHVVGKQWWWRVRYELPDGRSFELANEIRLPRGQRTSLWLSTEDVIHSLWVPSLGGKVDMIPGRVNPMAFEPTKTGRFRGACAEYCGLSHARMTIVVVVVEPAEFEAWLDEQLAPAAPAKPEALHGERLFAMHGCGACHTIRGTGASGMIGPDLTHVGSRAFVADVSLENSVAGFSQWLTHTDHVKPGARMPTFDMLSEEELFALATYLEGLE